MHAELLQYCRQRLARERAWRGFYPSFLRQEGQGRLATWDGVAFKKFFTDQELLLSHGRVVWGHVVQAHELLFREGAGDHPAAVLFSEDEHFEEHVEELGNLAALIYGLKGKESVAPELAELAGIVTDELRAVFNLDLPPSITGGRCVVLTTILVLRHHLPTGRLSAPFFPCLVFPLETSASMILPWSFWPEGLNEAWREWSRGEDAGRAS